MKAPKFIFILVLSIISISLMIFAQEPNTKYSKTETANLINGIKSENIGVMKASIYFAGKYKVPEATNALLEILDRDLEPSTVILVTFAIYQIGDKDAMVKVIEKATNSDSVRIQNVLSAVALQYFIESDISFNLM